MNGASVVASLPLTSPLITPSTGEAEPRGSSCVLYDAYNTFCTIPIRNVLNATNEGIWTLRMNGASVVASLPLTSPLITPSTGEAEPRGSSCALYDTYNTFCTIHICNIWTARRARELSWLPLRHTFDPLIEGSSWSKRLSLRGKLGAS